MRQQVGRAHTTAFDCLPDVCSARRCRGSAQVSALRLSADRLRRPPRLVLLMALVCILLRLLLSLPPRKSLDERKQSEEETRKNTISQMQASQTAHETRVNETVREAASTILIGALIRPLACSFVCAVPHRLPPLSSAGAASSSHGASSRHLNGTPARTSSAGSGAAVHGSASGARVAPGSGGNSTSSKRTAMQQ